MKKNKMQNLQKRRPLTKKQKRNLIVVCATLLVLAACYTVFIAPLLKEEKWYFKEVTVERGNLLVGVIESGSLEYGVQSVQYELDLSVGSDEEEEDEDEEETVQRYLEIEEIHVSPGQRIEEGDVLLTFTQKSIENVRKLLNSELVEAKTESNEAQSDYDLAVLEAKSEYEASVLAGKNAADILNYSGASVVNEINSLQIQITQRQANVESLEDSVDEAQESFHEAQATYDEAKASLDAADSNNINWYETVLQGYVNAESKYQSSKSALDRAKQSLEDNAKQITKLQKQLETAKAQSALNQMGVKETYNESVISSENASILYNAKVESLKSALEEVQSEEEAILEQMEAFEAFVGEEGKIYAAQEGIITEVLYEAGDELVTQGSILSYATMDDMTISVDVTQEDVPLLQVGDAVDIQFAAYENQAFEGTILEMNTTATSQNSNTVSYTVLIGVGGETELLYGGMTADITFVREKKENVLYVSKKAIVEKDGKTYVYTKESTENSSLQEIETGLSNGVSIEIVSGLEEGDVLYIASRVSDMDEGSSQNNTATGDKSAEDFTDSDMELPEGMEDFMNGDVQIEGMESFQAPDNMGDMPGGGMEMPGGGNMQRPGGDSTSGNRGQGGR